VRFAFLAVAAGAASAGVVVVRAWWEARERRRLERDISSHVLHRCVMLPSPEQMREMRMGDGSTVQCDCGKTWEWSQAGLGPRSEEGWTQIKGTFEEQLAEEEEDGPGAPG